MCKPASLMQLLPQWQELTSQLLPMCTPDALDLASLPPADVERLRQSAETLSLVIWSWQITHRTAPTPNLDTGA